MRRLSVIGAAVAAAAILTFAAPMAAADGECSCKRPLATPQDSAHLPRPLATIQDIGPPIRRPLAAPQDGAEAPKRPLVAVR